MRPIFATTLLVLAQGSELGSELGSRGDTPLPAAVGLGRGASHVANVS